MHADDWAVRQGHQALVKLSRFIKPMILDTVYVFKDLQVQYNDQDNVNVLSFPTPVKGMQTKVEYIR